MSRATESGFPDFVKHIRRRSVCDTEEVIIAGGDESRRQIEKGRQNSNLIELPPPQRGSVSETLPSVHWNSHLSPLL